MEIIQAGYPTPLLKSIYFASERESQIAHFRRPEEGGFMYEDDGWIGELVYRPPLCRDLATVVNRPITLQAAALHK